jgi:DNA-binding MarR family transcriptional regulator
MNDLNPNGSEKISAYQLQQFQDLITRLFQCCQERMQYQSEKFDLPDAELRCIVDGLIKKDLIQRIKDPEDSRISLLSLTPMGQKKLDEIRSFLEQTHHQVLRQMAPEQRKTLLINLDLLKASMEAVKEMMV